MKGVKGLMKDEIIDSSSSLDNDEDVYIERGPYKKNINLLSKKHMKVIEGILGGLTNIESLKAAGFAKNNQVVIKRIQPELKRLMDKRSNIQINTESFSKNDCVNVLRKIAMNGRHPALQIRAVETLSKICGYFAPLQSENLNVTQLRMIEDDSLDVKGDISNLLKPTPEIKSIEQPKDVLSIDNECVKEDVIKSIQIIEDVPKELINNVLPLENVKDDLINNVPPLENVKDDLINLVQDNVRKDFIKMEGDTDKSKNAKIGNSINFSDDNDEMFK